MVGKIPEIWQQYILAFLTTIDLHVQNFHLRTYTDCSQVYQQFSTVLIKLKLIILQCQSHYLINISIYCNICNKLSTVSAQKYKILNKIQSILQRFVPTPIKTQKFSDITQPQQASANLSNIETINQAKPGSNYLNIPELLEKICNQINSLQFKRNNRVYVAQYVIPTNKNNIQCILKMFQWQEQYQDDEVQYIYKYNSLLVKFQLLAKTVMPNH
eukprot:TRINITY_DN8080_c0_g1_i1.p2 TRINITY_DN8080_c0_g1~~TRINITY_DN8080_c0_g1_i1.p2  ORF type:complete len:215 (-),score=-17.33 TRINITY_DN8080_c0_g1_i1:20-664(-)